MPFLNPGDPKTAVCTCGTALICTFEVPKKEWYCMNCEIYLEWLQARAPQNQTPELEEQHDVLLARFKQGERTLEQKS